jgi:hypothetical protein
MIPENFRAFGGGGETMLSPLALAMLGGCLITMWFLPRRYLLIPFVATALLVPLTQQVVVFGLHLTILRIAIVCAWVRVLVKGGLPQAFIKNGFNVIDKVFVAWIVSGTITYTLLYADVGALIFKVGYAFNILGIYFLFRHLTRDRADVMRLVRILAVLCVAVAAVMLLEQLTGHNLFSLLGGSLEDEVRNGRTRAEGPFVHPIIAGTFGAMLMPVFASMWWLTDSKRYAITGAISTAVMIVTSASSTPVAGCLAGLVALCIWPLRRWMRVLRWATVGIIVGLHFAMKSPVWALLARFDAVGGSSGWHRFMLVDQFIQHVGDWWLVGTTSNASWGYDMWDRANWYVASGETGGLATFALFVAVIGCAFRLVGIGRRYCTGDKSSERFVWGLGAALFASTVSFVGINLIDQSIIAWCAILASISAARSGVFRVLTPELHKTSLEPELIFPGASPPTISAPMSNQ